MLKALYDERYQGDYREHLAGFEIARWQALDHFICKVVGLSLARSVLDYGAGSGLFVGLWEKAFPEAQLHFCDISSVAMERFRAKYPKYADHYELVIDNRALYAGGSFDVVVSVEVMEHVEDVSAYAGDVFRLLKPGGHFVWTTPCANQLSIEHVRSWLKGRIETTKEGYERFTEDEPGHLRRLKSREVETLLRKIGFDNVRFRFRAHLFSFLCSHTMAKSMHLSDSLMSLDYAIFRRLPNGASMIGVARKPIAGADGRANWWYAR